MPYVIYFDKEFKPGEHWNPEKAHPSDVRQHWKKGEAYSMSSTEPVDLPSHFKYKEVSAPAVGEMWDPVKLNWAPIPTPKFDDSVAQELADAGLLDAANFIENKRKNR